MSFLSKAQQWNLRSQDHPGWEGPQEVSSAARCPWSHPCSWWTGATPLASFCRACAAAMMVSVATSSTHSSLFGAIIHERITHNLHKTHDLIVLCPEGSVQGVQTTHLSHCIGRGGGCACKMVSPPPGCHFNGSGSLEHQILSWAQGLPSARYHCRGSALLAPEKDITQHCQSRN